MVVGEQPGDEEDRTGLPFVGPAGRLLDELLHEASIQRSEAYVTNVVKHFKWAPRGKRRIHAKPNARELRACLPWFLAELRVLRPRGLLLLGATPARARETLTGRARVPNADEHGERDAVRCDRESPPKKAASQHFTIRRTWRSFLPRVSTGRPRAGLNPSRCSSSCYRERPGDTTAENSP